MNMTVVSQPKGTGTKFAYEQIRRAILQGELRPGSAISEKEMIQKFSISRTPLREAITRLSAENLVDLRSNKSAIIADPTPTGVSAYLEAKACLDRAICFSAAKRLDRKSRTKLEIAAAKFRSNPKPTLEDVNQILHQISDTAQNSYLAFEFIRLHETGFRLAYLNNCVHEYSEMLVDRLLDIVTLVLEGDSVGARDAAAKLAENSNGLFLDVQTSLPQ